MAWKRAGTERFVASIGLVLAGAAAAHAAAVTEVTSRAALGANDLLDWGMLPGGYPEALPNPIMAISAGGLVVTLGTTPDRFINSYGTTFNSITDFAPTDNLIGTQQFTPIKLSFCHAGFWRRSAGRESNRRSVRNCHHRRHHHGGGGGGGTGMAEPATIALFGVGLLGLAAARRRRH